MSSDVSGVGSVVVVGGGSSGWMAAAYLSNALLGVDVTLVESPRVPVIGVGEATIPFIRNYMRRLGFDDDMDWMPQCDATFKTGILFEDWLSPGENFWHPFEYLDYVDTHLHSGHCWLHLHHQGHPGFRDRQSFYHSFFPSTTLNVLHGKMPSGDTGYAYHFDAGRFGELLRRSSPAVRHVFDDITHVNIDSRGNIRSLATAEHGELAADLYVDCTGFKGLLIHAVAPDQQFVSYADSLFCDRAVVIRLPYDDGKGIDTQMHPYVKATARSAGWIWAIPLYSRLSSGYVYSSGHITDDEAELELRRFLDERRTEGVDSHRLGFRSGKLERHWVANCVAIGLSGGFIEPLESTGVALSQIGVEVLASILDSRTYDEKDVSRFNGHLDKVYTDVFEFIVAHYCLTAREDTPFWKSVKHDTAIPDQLAARFEVFKRHLPTAFTKGTGEAWMFRDVSWFCVLLGMDFTFDVLGVGAEAVEQTKRLLASKRLLVEKELRRLPGHYRYLHGTGLYAPARRDPVR